MANRIPNRFLRDSIQAQSDRLGDLWKPLRTKQFDRNPPALAQLAALRPERFGKSKVIEHRGMHVPTHPMQIIAYTYKILLELAQRLLDLMGLAHLMFQGTGFNRHGSQTLGYIVVQLSCQIPALFFTRR